MRGNTFLGQSKVSYERVYPSRLIKNLIRGGIPFLTNQKSHVWGNTLLDQSKVSYERVYPYWPIKSLIWGRISFLTNQTSHMRRIPFLTNQKSHMSGYTLLDQSKVSYKGEYPSWPIKSLIWAGIPFSTIRRGSLCITYPECCSVIA